jgi:hypothetical protein
MDSYHGIYLQWTVTITCTCNEWLRQHLLTMKCYHNTNLKWTVTKAFTYNKRYHYIYLQLTVNIESTYNGRLP